MATFITSKAVGESINIYVQTSTGFWKYNHDGSDSSVFGNGQQSITITNANPLELMKNFEFTIISCDSDGTVSGDVTDLRLQNNQLTSFDGTGLSSLTTLYLGGNLLTSLDVSSLTSLIDIRLGSIKGRVSLMTPSANNQILQQLNQNGLSGGVFECSNGRTSASNTDYNNLASLGWQFVGLDLITPPIVGSGKLRVKGVTTGI